jgi:hypothetical protein
MLKFGLASLNAIAQGAKIKFIVRIYFQVPEDYTKEDRLLDIGSINTSLSSVGSYEIGNSTISLSNKDFYFSRKFKKELPNNRKVEIFIDTGFEKIRYCAGMVKDNSWQLTPTLLTLNINA